MKTEAATEAYTYVTYIESTPERLWQAVTEGNFTQKYWRHPGDNHGYENVSDWKPGSPWEHREKDMVHLVGKVIEAKKPEKLVLTWARPAEADNPDKVSRVTFDIEAQPKAVKLTVTHEDLEAGSNMLEGITRGWPVVLAGLKTYLESGRTLSLARY